MLDNTKYGTLVADVDGATYWRVDWIVSDDGSGRWPQWYCDAAEWPSTPIGKLARRDSEIATLKARIALLEEQLATHTIPPAVAAAAVGMPAETDVAVAVKRPAYINSGHRTPCPVCGKKIWRSLLDRHLIEQHPETPPAVVEALEMPERPEPAPETANEPAPELADDPPAPPRPLAPIRPIQHPPATPPALAFDGWRCKTCGSDVYARAMHEPDLCLRCFKQAQNGHAPTETAQAGA